MTRLRAIGTELVERKLWPVALLLVIAAVALPMVLGGGGDKAGAPAPVQVPVPASGQQAAVISVTDVTASRKRNRKGSVRDPFVQQHVPAKVGATATGTSGGAGPSVNLTPSSPLDSNYGPNPVSGDSGTSTPSGPSTSPGTSLPSGSTAVYHAVVRVKQLGKVRWLHDVARYDHLPSDKQRYVLFLGVLTDHKTALFSMMTPAYLYGNARCRPSRRACATFEMRVGSTELLSLPQADGSVRRVRITLQRIFVKRIRQAKAKAGASRTRRANQSYAASFAR